MTLLRPNFQTDHGLRTQEMAFPGFKYQKMSGGGMPRTPLVMRDLGI